MMWWKKSDDLPEKVHGDIEYHVKVEDYEAGEYDLVFNTRDVARKYKQCLRESRRQLIAHIIKREYSGEFIANETEVW